MFSSRAFSSIALSAFTVVALTTSALAQIVPQADPNQIERRFEPRPRATIPSTPIVTPAPAPEARQMDPSIRLVLKQIDVKGNTLYSDEEMRALYADKIGKDISLSEVQAIANAITVKYRTDGYVLSQAVLPAQKIDDGRVTIQVVEGFVQNVVVEGETAKRKLVEQYANHIRTEGPLNIKTLERYLLLANDLPGVSARAVLRPSTTTTGAADVIVTVEEDKFEGSFSVDNRGTDFLGPVQFTTVLTGNNLAGIYDGTTFRNVLTSDPSELQFYDVRHEEQIGTDGTKFLGIASYSHSEPGSTLDQFDVKGESLAFSLGGSHPFIRSRNENLTVRSNIDYRNTTTDFAGFELSDDKIRALRVGVEYDRADAWNGVNLISFEVGQGLPIFGATDAGINRSRTDGVDDFTKFNIDLSRLHTINDAWSVLASATGQYSLDPLLSAEEFSLGGANFGQAYDPSELTGDHGAAARIELRYGDITSFDYFNSYQLYTYYDIGAVWQKTSAVNTTSNRQSLSDAGVGVRFNITNYVSADTQLAVPLTRDVATNGNDSPNVFFRLTARF